MLIALNLMVAAVIVGGITGVIVHAVRIQDAHGARGHWQLDHLLALWTEHFEQRRAAHVAAQPMTRPVVSASRA